LEPSKRVMKRNGLGAIRYSQEESILKGVVGIGARKKKILTVQSRNVYENKGSLDIMTDEIHVFEASFRTL